MLIIYREAIMVVRQEWWWCLNECQGGCSEDCYFAERENESLLVFFFFCSRVFVITDSVAFFFVRINGC